MSGELLTFSNISILACVQALGVWWSLARKLLVYLKTCSPGWPAVLLLFYFRGAESLLNQGIEWEKKGEYNRAIEMYMKITPSMTTDHELVEDAMVKVSVISQEIYC